MDSCNCPIVTKEELRALLNAAEPAGKTRVAAYLVDLLTSREKAARARGYELFKEGIHDALLCSCFNYGGLVGGMTHPLFTVLADSIERWATALDREEPGPCAKKEVCSSSENAG